MSGNGHPPNGGRGVDDPRWADDVVDRRPAAEPSRAGAPASPAGDESTQPLPIVPIEAPVPTDGLPEISWYDTPQVSPAATPIAPQTALTAHDAGRSAWSDGLGTLNDEEPQGWDKLSWQDLDERGTTDADRLREQSPFVKLLREWGPVVLVAVTIAVVTRLFFVQAYHIPSLSMLPTLEEGDRVIVNRLSYQFGEIERGQVVVFNKPQNQPAGANDLIKRVIGLPGETVEFREGDVFVDGLLLQEPYLAEQGSTRGRPSSIPGCAQAEPSPTMCLVPTGYIFVMGDNRTGSQDSRVFGPISEDSVVGRAFIRIWPFGAVDWL